MAFSKFFVNGQKGLGENWAQWFGDFFSNFVGTGFEITEDTGLNVNISAGRAYVKDEDGLMFQIISSATESLTMTDDSTNYVYLHCDNGSSWLTTDTVGTVDTDAILLGVVTTDTGAITDIANVPRNNPMLEQEYISETISWGMSAISASSGSSFSSITTTNYFYFNPFQNKITTLKQIKFTLDVTPNKLSSGKLYYNIGSGSDVEIFDYKTNGDGDYTLTEDDLNIEIPITNIGYLKSEIVANGDYNEFYNEYYYSIQRINNLQILYSYK